jgi:hypothetical protein
MASPAHQMIPDRSDRLSYEQKRWPTVEWPVEELRRYLLDGALGIAGLGLRLVVRTALSPTPAG